MPISEVYNEDCMEVMKRFDDKFFDLAIVDPPYGIKQDGRNNHTRSKLCKSKNYSNKSKYDNSTPNEKYFKELFIVSKNQIIWGGNYFINFLSSTSCFIVWDKNNGETDFADCELAWTNFSTATRKVKYKWQGMLQEDMKNKEVLIHPNHKPIYLYKWCLDKYAEEGYKILDTHLGSQSSRIAAFNMGFDFWGCEIDKEYFDLGNKRFKEETAQISLF